MIDTLSRYVYEVYRCKSMSKAAKKLFVSQPALSASVKKAEAKLGAAIFNRKTIPFTLTPEGKIYIDAIEQMLNLETQTKARIQDIAEFKSGTLKIATGNHLAYFVIPLICGIFREKYPNIDIRISILDSAQLPVLLEKKEIDLAFTAAEITNPNIQVEPLFEEKFVVAVRKDNPCAVPLMPYALTRKELLHRTYPKEKQIADMTMFQEMEFVYTTPKGRNYKKRKLVFGKTETDHYITSTSNRVMLNYALMNAGFGALFTTDATIATLPVTADCYYFALQNSNARETLSICHCHADASPTDKTIQAFITVAKELFDRENPLEVLLSR